MRMLKKAAIATITAGSLALLGAGTAAADTKKPDVKIKNDLKQSQTCTYKALIPVNVVLGGYDNVQGSFACSQTGSIG